MSTSNQSQIAFENGPKLPTEAASIPDNRNTASQEISNLIAHGNIRRRQRSIQIHSTGESRLCGSAIIGASRAREFFCPAEQYG